MIILPYTIIFIIIAVFLFLTILKDYLLASREIIRINSILKASVTNNFQDIIYGSDVIRVMAKNDFFKNKFLNA